MPALMQQRMAGVMRHDLLNQYAELEQVGQALDMIAGRIRFANEFAGIVEEIAPRYRELEQGFLLFYPALQQAVVHAALEQDQGSEM